MRIPFTVWGAGNDFVVLDQETQGRFGLTTAHYRFWRIAISASARTGLTVRPSPAPGINWNT
jgi:diaminopimelate epimerase